ncbi:hypothetical protein [Singulisphaera acidiphila]|uniref:Uncharacterized protein n=1 Tax=Singulisphaera acidiphila (strain ATCC BAA-1392 / DSM 18658 / VKM B-2454 / MOB10) TaxID=886293 RepID=L0DFL2_SINAD|nr:hypothetical protein [Singulisphaera acidiphila]AGA28169.1 hypothetical protein Sinac_3941 [Singulisphaera acidiphila DSM 18658]
MGATVPRHALIFRVHRLALAGMTGAWLVAGMLCAGPARAGEPGGALAGSSPSPKQPPQANASLPVSAARRSPHQAYLFFSGSKRPPQHPAGAEKGQTAAGPLVEAQRPAYLFFTPGKKTPPITPAPVDERRPSYRFFTPEKKKTAQTPTTAPATGQVPPGPPPTPGSGLDPSSKRPALALKAAVAGDGLPLTPPQPRLLFFAPKRGAANANAGHSPATNQTARPEGRKPTMLAAIERVPVRLPGTPAQNRNPPPYLIFQPKPKPVRDRLSPAPKANGTSSSATTPPRQGGTAVARTPWPAARREFPGFDLVPTLTLADLPRLRFAPITAPAVGSGSGGGNQPAPRLR